MNLLLLDANELADDGTVRLHDRRAQHLLVVLRVTPGCRLCAGVVDGPTGEAEVLAVGEHWVSLRCRLDQPPPPRSDDTLLLAIPRPKVLLRVLEHATALGFGRIVLLRTWRVDKSHLRSRATTAPMWQPRLRAGLEQARRTMLPDVTVEARFRPFVEDRLDAVVPAGARFVAHPDAPAAVWETAPGPAALTLAIGPERGLLPYEIDALTAHGFTAVHAGSHPVRVETAVPLLYGQLALLRRRPAAH